MIVCYFNGGFSGRLVFVKRKRRRTWDTNNLRRPERYLLCASRQVSDKRNGFFDSYSVVREEVNKSKFSIKVAETKALHPNP